MILQQSLIFKDQNYSFENGLSGVGYVLCYLINNRFIEADFDEIFGKQFENIIDIILNKILYVSNSEILTF